MCGFAGGILFDPNGVHRRDVLERMGEVLQHRGPDDHGLFAEGPCGLVHRRLSVIDLSANGSQPMGNEDGTCWIAYNGEVYNYRELRSRYRLDDRHSFRSSTDTEVLLHLFQELGEDFLTHLNGMYAIALWNSRSRKLLLARDPFGVKPLFYTETEHGFWFASEIKSLLEVPGVERKPSLEALNGFLAFNYVPDTLTAFQGIHELAPGTAIVVSPERGVEKKWRFFEMEYTEDRSISFEDAWRDSLEILENSIQRSLIADVPVGVMLSGGMDSSSMTALMARSRGETGFHTFSLSFDHRDFDESDYAKIVAEKFRTRHHTIRVTPEKVKDLLPVYLAHIDEPYGDGSAIPTWLLSEKASEHVTVLLSGEGGDEVYAGYDTHAAYRARQLYRRVPVFLRTGVVRPLVNLLPVSHGKLSLEFKAKRFVAGAELGIPESHFFWRAVLSADARSEVLREPEKLGNINFPTDLYTGIYNSCKAEPGLNRLLCIDSSCHLPNDLMIKNDRMTMAHSIEARVPFTDMELFRYLASVPSRHKLPGMKKKALLRRSMQGILPDIIVNKKKVGLEMPYSRWMRNELREITMEYLRPERLSATGLFNPESITRLWRDHDTVQADNGRVLWGIMNYMIWHEMYIDSTGYRSSVKQGTRR